MHEGANLVLKTVDAVIKNDYPQIKQNKLNIPEENLKYAPKILKNDCKIKWDKEPGTIHNLVRGLSPYPASWAKITNNKDTIQLKIFKTEKEIGSHKYNPGHIVSDNKTFLKVAVKSGYIKILELQQAGKKRLHITDFLRGFQDINSYTFSTKA